MAWTPTTFRARWTEFAPTADAVVQAALNEAARRTDARVFGDRTDDAVGLLAAHNLSISPQGMPARLESKDGETTYMVALKLLRRERAGGAWAIGQGPTGWL